jgi:hypothetical protein
MRNKESRILHRALCLLGLLLATGLGWAAQSHRVDADTGAETWETQNAGVTLAITQILPDQVRAFYINRGFPAEAIESYARSCVYMTVLRNDAAPGVVQFRLAEWTVDSVAERRPPVAVDTWMQRLRPLGLGQPAMIAFRWAQFPPEQAYEPGGDWNQGMLAMGLPAGAEFDLVARWEVDGENYEGIIENARCAP